MRRLACTAVLTVGLGLPALAQEHRELGPHVHGAGTLKIAIDGNTVAMDFSAPANDIIGFEHPPSTAEQRAVLDAAKRDLGQPLALFELPAAAGCTLGSANVVFNAAEPAAPGAAPANAAADAAHQHADFDVDYVITCAAAGKITALSFPYFARFAGAQKLTVTVVSGTGQSEFDVTRASPRHDLK